jgi:photosystem II stability/assembly factor-like uncharacterized protein
VFDLLFSVAFTQQDPQWRFANGPYEGEVHKLAIDPQRPNIIYAAVTGGHGLYKSTDGGITWFDVAPEKKTGSLEPTVALCPINSSTVYYGGEKYGTLNKSTDGGMTWEKKFLLQGSVRHEIKCIAIDPFASNIIYVGLHFENNRAIWKSTDGGETWSVKTSGIPKRDSTQGTHGTAAIKINPLNSSVLFADVSLDGLYRSDDAAETWYYVGFFNTFVQDIEILPWDTSTVLVGTWAGLYKSTDGGRTWRNKNGYDVRCIQSDRSTHSLYFGTYWENGAFKSTDDGETWISIINPEIPTSMSSAMDVFDIAVDPLDPNRLYLGTLIGPYKSTNGGLTWEQHFDGMKNYFAYSIVSSPSNPSIIYTAGRDGVHRSTDHGATWKYVGIGATLMGIEVDPVNPEIVYGAIVGIDMFNRVVRTTNGGKVWQIMPLQLSPTFINFIKADRSSQRVVYVSTYDEFLRSYDQGTTWEAIHAPIVPSMITIQDNNPNLIYIQSPYAIYKSTNRGKSWDSIRFNNNGRQIILKNDPLDFNIIFVMVLNQGVYRSTNGGLDWEDINNGINNFEFLQVIINPKNPNNVFLKNGNGVFQSTDGGNQWSFLLKHPAFDSVGFYGITLDTCGSGRFLIGGNRFPGVYTFDLSTSVGENGYQQLPRSFELFQNYPNPFNPLTSIEYRLSKRSRVQLDIFDLLGRTIATPVHSVQESGSYKIVWNGENTLGEFVASGIYICRLTAGEYSITKKMVLIH